MPVVTSSPPRAPPIKYIAPLGTRWAKEKAAAGGSGAFDLPTDPKCIGPWILGECVGKGASGRVKIAKHNRTGQLAAVKILPVAPLVNSRASLATQQAKSDKLRLGIDREITMMKLMNHPNIMRIYDVYEGDKELFLVLEYVEGGELFDFLVNRGRLPPGEALAYFKQIIYGLNYAHTFSIIHRDLKPENILIASISPPLIKIADWGMAAFAPPSLQLETSCGSPHYASPEIVNGEKYSGNATDIWSCGVILYALLTGRLPFDDKNVRTLLGKVKSGKYEMPAWIDPQAKDLLRRMLVVDVAERIMIPDILAHPWLQSATTTNCLSDAVGETETLKLLTPPLPPSPSTLARPIASPSSIDPDLLSSLRVIWGRHTDPHGESIRRDLCAPAGKGVHAKAFYFLLGRYRDESLREHAEAARAQEQARTEANKTALGSMKFDLGWELDLSTVNKKYDGNGASALLATPPVHQHPSPATLRMSTIAPPIMTRGGTTSSTGSTRERPASPAGPRAATSSAANKVKGDAKRAEMVDQSFPAPQQRQTSSLGAGRGGPRPPPLKQGPSSQINPSSHDVSAVGVRPTRQHPNDFLRRSIKPKTAIRPNSALGIPASVDAARKSMFLPSRPVSPSFQGSPPGSPPPAAAHVFMQPLPALSVIHTPVPLSASAHKLEVTIDAGLDLHLDLLGAPNADVELMKSLDEIAEHIHGLAVKAVDSLAGCVEPDADHSVQLTPAVEPREPVAVSYEREVPVRPQHVPSRTASTKSQAKRAFKIDVAEDKENMSAGEEGWSYIGHDEVNGAIGIGLGMGRDVGRDMGNIAYPLDGMHLGKGRKGKGRKERAATLDLPSPNLKRSSVVPLGSPMSLSQPSAYYSRMSSPAVGEVKGWFSNLFNWKAHHSNGQGGILYSADDVFRTRIDVGRQLEALGVNVDGNGYGAENTNHPNYLAALKCKVDDLNPDAITNMHLKPVKFRVEFACPTHSPRAIFSPTLNMHHLTSPNPNIPLIDTPNPSINPKSVTNIFATRHGVPNLSPNPSSGIAFPPGSASAIILVHEKGSASTFRIVWRRLKDVYGSIESAAYPVLSPTMASSPMVEQPQRFAI